MPLAGKSWWSFIRQELILPAEMKNTEFHVERGSRVVTGHVFDSENRQIPLPDEAYLERGWAAGAGGLESTVGDLALWNTALYSGRIVSDESLHLMTSPIADTGNGVFYGYGLFIAQDPDTKEQVFYHTGGIPGFTSYNTYYPARKMSVISIGSIVAREAIDFGKALARIELSGSADLEAYTDDQRPPSPLDKSIAGRFAPAGASAELEITSEDGGLYVSFPGANTKHRLVIRGDGRYYDRAAGVEFQFDLWNTTGFTLKVGDRLIPHSRVVPASHLAALARSHSR